MKKIINILLLGILGILLYGVISLSKGSKDVETANLSKTEYIPQASQISELEEQFFDKFYEKDLIESQGIPYVDFVNASNKNKVELGNGITMDYDFLAHRLRDLTLEERRGYHQLSLTSEISEAFQLSDLMEFLDESRSSSEIEEHLLQLDWLEDNPPLTNLILPNLNNNMNILVGPHMSGSLADYEEYPVSYSSSQIYDSQNTYICDYIQYKQFYFTREQDRVFSLNEIPVINQDYLYTHLSYVGFGQSLGQTTSYRNRPYDFYEIDQNIFYEWIPGFLDIPSLGRHTLYPLGSLTKVEKRNFTGISRYDFYNVVEFHAHNEVLTPFTYKSYNDSLLIHIPLATITLILDYENKQKLILTYYDEILENVTTFYITQDIHWNRNNYNVNSNGVNLTIAYPTFGSLSGNGYTQALVPATYFHRLQPENSGNIKLLKKTSYYDANLHLITEGEFELVYTGNTASSTVVTNSLVKGTFNFGTEESYGQTDSTFDFGITIYGAPHYVKDVYPYLIWGNDFTDYNNHSAFERFVWDKDSVNITNHQYHNLSGAALTSYYPTGILTLQGTPIPAWFINHNFGGRIIGDYTPPTFNLIDAIQIEITVSYVDWLSYVTNLSDDRSGPIFLYVGYDQVNYGHNGFYEVKICARDQAGNIFFRIIAVRI
ncbi:MAG: hypothetical protein EZS28_030608, partial [Streblomastix strix]